MTVTMRLVLVMVAAVGLVGLPAAYGVSRMAELRGVAFSLRANHAEAFLAAGRLQATLTEVDRSLRGYVATGEEEHGGLVQAAVHDLQRGWSALMETGHLTDRAAAELRIDRLQAGIAHLDSLVGAGSFEEATAYLPRVVKELDAWRSELGRVAHAIDGRSEAELAKAQRISTMATRTMFIAGIVAVLLVTAIGVWTTAALAVPLRQVRDSISNVAAGELIAPKELPYHRQDEIGDLARSFRYMTLRLRELDRLRTEFISMIGHDLKTPLHLISGYAELVEERSSGRMSADQKEMLASILEQTRSLSGTVTQLVNLHRMEAGAFRLDLEPVDLRVFAGALERTFAPLARQKGIELTVEVEPTVPATVIGDVGCLTNEIMYNLFSNAFKFTPEGGRIEFRIRADAEGVHLTLTDTGAGIPHEELPHVFDKFYQVTARREGAGLGLAIVKQVAEAHGGRVSVASHVGSGTTFDVVLPTSPPLKLAAPSPEPPRSTAIWGAAREALSRRGIAVSS